MSTPAGTRDTANTSGRREAAAGRTLQGAPDDVLGRIYGPIRGRLRLVEKVLGETARRGRRLLRDMALHLLRHPGKRIRAALLLFSARAGRKGDGRREAELAAIVEMIHLASLVHDDIIDAAPRRRGVRSLHAAWGTQASVLMGDFLFSRVANLLVARFPLAVLSPLLKAAEEMCDGEIEEESVAYHPGLGEKRYLSILRRKTAALMSASCRVGATLAGAPKRVADTLARFGASFGMGFQITDDALDFCADERRLGKPVGRDLASGRITYPVMFLRTELRGRERDRLAGLLTRSSLMNGGARSVADLVVRHGCVARTMARADRCFSDARATLAGVPAEAARPLRELAEYAALRRK